MRDVGVLAGEDVAYCFSINGVKGTTRSGTELNMWWRATACFGWAEGKWLVMHAHSSEPFDMQSGKALTDLKP
jgi:ketosteroid isomerase-like protein